MVIVEGGRKNEPQKRGLMGSVKGSFQNAGDQQFTGVPVGSAVGSAQLASAGRQRAASQWSSRRQVLLARHNRRSRGKGG